MASKSPKTQGLRVTDEQLARLQACSNALTVRAAGTEIGIPTIIRLCIERGLPLLEDELSIKERNPKGKKS